MKILLSYYSILNILLYIMMWIDKTRAKKDARRIPEAHLFVVALLGGALGGFLGMLTLRHKTKKLYFYIIFFLACNLHLALGYVLLGKILLQRI